MKRYFVAVFQRGDLRTTMTVTALNPTGAMDEARDACKQANGRKVSKTHICELGG